RRSVGNRLVNHWIGVRAGGNRGMRALTEVLIHAVAFIEGADGGFESPTEVIELGGIQALVIDALRREDRQHVTAVGQEGALVKGGLNRDELVKRARFLMVLPDPTDPLHRRSFRMRLSNFKGS